MSITVINPNNIVEEYTYGKRGRKPFWVLELENAIPKLNKIAKKCQAPYNVPMDKNGPHVISSTSTALQVFDGWTEVIFTFNHPGEATIKSEQVIENLKKRAMCIQRRLMAKRICDYNSFVDLLGKGVRDTAQNDEDGVTDAEERQSQRTNIVI